MHSRRTVLGAAIGGVLGLGVVVGAATEARAGSPPHHLGYSSVRSTRRAVALTFDDGPHPRFTPAVLDLLAAHGAHATFFVVGRAVYTQPALVRRAVNEGHEVANHTLSHARLDRLDLVGVRSQLKGGAEAISSLGLGPLGRPRLVRAPYGFEGPESREEMLSGGWEVARWRGCLEHHLRLSSLADAVADMADAAQPGDILLAHDGGTPDRRTTLAALPVLLDALVANGFAVTSIGGLQAD